MEPSFQTVILFLDGPGNIIRLRNSISSPYKVKLFAYYIEFLIKLTPNFIKNEVVVPSCSRVNRLVGYVRTTNTYTYYKSCLNGINTIAEWNWLTCVETKNVVLSFRMTHSSACIKRRSKRAYFKFRCEFASI